MFAYFKLNRFIENLTDKFDNLTSIKRLPLGVIGLLIISISWIIPSQTLKLCVMFAGFLIALCPFISRYKYMALLFGYSGWFIKSIKPVEYINYTAESKYGIARFKESKLILSIHSESLVLEDDGTISTSSLYYFWLPLKHNERIQHILSTNLPDFESLRKIENLVTRRTKIEYEYWRRRNG